MYIRVLWFSGLVCNHGVYWITILQLVQTKTYCIYLQFCLLSMSFTLGFNLFAGSFGHRMHLARVLHELLPTHFQSWLTISFAPTSSFRTCGLVINARLGDELIGQRKVDPASIALAFQGLLLVYIMYAQPFIRSAVQGYRPTRFSFRCQHEVARRYKNHVLKKSQS